MQWFDPGGIWTKRASLTLDISAGDSPSEFAIPIPTAWDKFWNAIDTDGNELRVVSANGELLQYTLDGFSKDNREGTILLDAMQTPGIDGAMLCAWLYFGSTSDQGAATGTSPAGTPEDGYIELASPGGPYVLAHAPTVPGLELPAVTFAKTSEERADVWVRIAPAGSFTEVHSAQFLEGPYYCTHDAVDADGNPAASTLMEPNLTRFVWVPSGRAAGMWVRHLVKAGADGSVYTTSLRTRMVSPLLPDNGVRELLDTRIGWRVKDTRLTS